MTSTPDAFDPTVTTFDPALSGNSPVESTNSNVVPSVETTAASPAQAESSKYPAGDTSNADVQPFIPSIMLSSAPTQSATLSLNSEESMWVFSNNALPREE